MRGRASIDRLVRISQEMSGKGFPGRGNSVLWPESVRDGEESETYFAKEILPMNCLAFHIT